MNEILTAALPCGQLRLAVQAVQGTAADYIGIAARANAKRAFLFMSKVLGKHYPVRPSRMEAVHDLLASQIPLSEGPVVFIGMAETATGLGQGVFEAWQDMKPGTKSMYLHTTRYRVPQTEALVFEEAHSHAPNVFLTLPQDKEHRALFESSASVVLLDDELSTGNTFTHLVEVLCRVMPQLSRVHITTIADFMGSDRRQELPRLMGLPCSVNALLTGQWAYEGQATYSSMTPAQHCLGHEVCLEDSGYGRLGRVCPLKLSQEFVSGIVERVRSGKMLVLGTGEFMHAAFVLGKALEQHGCDVHVQATTRSPILEWGAISAIKHVPDVYGEGLANYLYNVHEGQYDHILICHEDGASAANSLSEALGGTLIRFAKGDHAQENPVH